MGKGSSLPHQDPHQEVQDRGCEGLGHPAGPCRPEAARRGLPRAHREHRELKRGLVFRELIENAARRP
eukprot:9242650-Heterocapsa_arctica.AAC.1